MAWIELHDTVFGHRKTRKLARLLNLPCVHAVGHLCSLWSWALGKTEDGVLRGVTAEHLADAAEYDGDAQAFANALVESGYLSMSDENFVVHDWMDYAGRLVEKRQSNAERQRRWRESQRTPDSNSDSALRNSDVTVSNGYETPKALRNDQPTNQPTNQEDLKRVSNILNTQPTRAHDLGVSEKYPTIQRVQDWYTARGTGHPLYPMCSIPSTDLMHIEERLALLVTLADRKGRTLESYLDGVIGVGPKWKGVQRAACPLLAIMGHLEPEITKEAGYARQDAVKAQADALPERVLPPALEHLPTPEEYAKAVRRHD